MWATCMSLQNCQTFAKSDCNRVQYHVSGLGSAAFLEKLTPSAASTLPMHQSTLSALLHARTGGICDDTIITRIGPEKFYVVTNAGCRQKDAAFLKAAHEEWKAESRPALDISELAGQGLLALQGPAAVSILQSLLTDSSSIDLSSIHFGQSKYLNVNLTSGPSVRVLASRGGYTGEDGFEISIPAPSTAALAEHMLKVAGPDTLRLAGLGARDSLRLEAGMCLYGHDLDDTTTPVEASLAWIIARSRRESGGFNGAEAVLPQLRPTANGGTGVQRRRVGMIVTGAPAREGAVILDGSGVEVGKVTSGCPSPTLGKNIAMGYVRTGLHTSGTELGVKVRGKIRSAVVAKMPFVPSKYWKGGVAPG